MTQGVTHDPKESLRTQIFTHDPRKSPTRMTSGSHSHSLTLTLMTPGNSTLINLFTCEQLFVTFLKVLTELLQHSYLTLL